MDHGLKQVVRSQMKSIWLDIELSDYENHMALPGVAQSQYLSSCLFEVLESYKPENVAILGCSGGNGLEKIDEKKIKKIICLDINPGYLKEAENRYKSHFKNIEFVCQDIASQNFKISNMDLIYAGLIFEYVDIEPAIINISKFLNKKGILAVVLQQPHENIPEVTPSKYKSLEKLSEIFRFVPPVKLIELCEAYNIRLISQKEVQLQSGKKFIELILRKF
jgi:ubiquinone/menaquinone biosynthesis C-methylase UbiE